MGLFKPAWMSKKQARALAAVESMEDEATLRRVVAEAPIEYVRIRAAEKIDELLDSVETLDNLTDMLMECVPQWISVNERLPEDSKQKIVFHSRGVSFAYYSRTGWFSSIGKSHYLQTVTHWMPLPNPPEKGREE